MCGICANDCINNIMINRNASCYVSIIYAEKWLLRVFFAACLRAWCPLYTKIKHFKRVLLFGGTDIPPNRQKSICVRTQIAKTEYLPAEYIPPTFSTRTPSPYSAGSSWGLLSRKIFYFFLNPLSTRSNYTSIFIFSDYRFVSRISYFTQLDF